jgi:hypothetical protein
MNDAIFGTIQTDRRKPKPKIIFFLSAGGECPRAPV